jgi:EAL and modified HD-GYP domain-containing signal transduction protein
VQNESVQKNPYETVFVARQPIFDKKLGCWGYKVLYRDNQAAEVARFNDQGEATLRAMSNLIVCPEAAAQSQKMCIPFPVESLRGGAPHVLPAANTVVEIQESVEASDELLDCLRGLKRDGFHVAVDDYQGRPGKEGICKLADCIIIDAWGKERAELSAIVDKARAYGVSLMAKRIEDDVSFDLTKELGFSLFLGFFFKKPTTLSARKLSSSDAARLRLFKIIKEEAPDFSALAKAIEADVSISYRLLMFLNSPFFGFNQKVTSVKKALMLAGWNQMKNWLRLVILTDLPAPTKARELCRLAAQRAKFLELAGQDSGRHDLAENLFLLGLFSLLDAMLDTPMSELVAHLPIDEGVTTALCKEQSEYSDWLQLLDSIESFDWRRLTQLSEILGLSMESLEKDYQDSIAWANGFFNSLR